MAPRAAGSGAPAGGQTRQMTDEERTKMREDMREAASADWRRQPPKMVEYTLYFDDWREVDGVKFPHSMRRASGGTTSEEWTITRSRSTRRSTEEVRDRELRDRDA